MASSDASTDPAVPARRPQADRAEFAAHFEAAFRVLWLIAVGIVSNRTLADDVVQEAALIALEKYDVYEPGTNFAAWMGQVVRNVALNHLRKETRRRGVSLEEFGGEGLPTRQSSTSRELRLGPRGDLPPEQSDFDDRVVLALAGVNPVARACLLLRTVEGLDYADIARLLEIPAGTAMSHVHRSRQYLRQQLADRGPSGRCEEMGT